jgi:hypothetical protein
MLNMAVLPDGSTFKLDGHTRCLLWERGEVKPPEKLYVDIWECSDIGEVKRLYPMFDSKQAVETTQDQLAGAARQAGLEFQTPMLKQGKYGSALKTLYRLAYRSWYGSQADLSYVCEAVNAYSNELRLLDSIRPSHLKFPMGIIMAAIATMKHDGDAAVEFWARFAEDKGRKDGTRMDAVQALTDVVTGARRVNPGDKRTKAQDLFNRGVTAYRGYRRGETYLVGKQGGVRAMKDASLLIYIRAHLDNGGE